MKNLVYIFAVLCMALLAGCTAAPEMLYVSPEGNDDFPGILEKPLKSFKGARDRIRNMEESHGDITVCFREGTYHFKNTVVLDREDSGSPSRTITYRAMEGEKPVFTSGTRIDGWARISAVDPVYKYLPEEARDQVFVADISHIARPVLHLADGNTGWVDLGKVNVTDYVTTEKFIHGESVEGQMWDPPEEKKYASFSRSMEGLSNADKALIFSIYTADFELQLVPVEEIDGKTLKAATPGGHRLALPEEGQQHGSGDLAFLHNLAEGITAPGLFASYPETGKIYLWTANGTDEIYAPTLNELIRIEGVPAGSEAWFSTSEENPVTNIVFDGITFTNCKYPVWQESDVAAQHDWAILDKDNALLRLRGAENILVKNCTFSKSGGAGIAMDLYAQQNVVEDCHFEYLGYEALRLCGYGIGIKDENRENILRNSEIHHVNEIHEYGAAVVVWNSGFNTIEKNYIHDFTSRAVLLSGPRCRAYCKNNQDLFPPDRVMREQAWPMARWDEIPDTALSTVIMHNDGFRWEEVNGIKELWKDRLSSHFRYLRGNVVRQNRIENGALALFADGIFYITGCAFGETNKILDNYIGNCGVDLPEANVPFRLIYLDGFSGDFDFARNLVYNCRFKFEAVAPYAWWGKMKDSPNLYYQVVSGDEEFGQDDGNICIGGGPDNPINEYLDDYRKMLANLESGDWPSTDMLPGNKEMQAELARVISELE